MTLVFVCIFPECCWILTQGLIYVYLYPSSSDYRVAWHLLQQKARECLQPAEQRVLLQRGLWVTDTSSFYREPPPSKTHGDTAITACESEEIVFELHKPAVITRRQDSDSISSVPLRMTLTCRWSETSDHTCALTCSARNKNRISIPADNKAFKVVMCLLHFLCVQFCRLKQSKYLHSFVHCPTERRVLMPIKRKELKFNVHVLVLRMDLWKTAERDNNEINH